MEVKEILQDLMTSGLHYLQGTSSDFVSKITGLVIQQLCFLECLYTNSETTKGS